MPWIYKNTNIRCCIYRMNRCYSPDQKYTQDKKDKYSTFRSPFYLHQKYTHLFLFPIFPSPSSSLIFSTPYPSAFTTSSPSSLLPSSSSPPHSFNYYSP